MESNSQHRPGWLGRKRRRRLCGWNTREREDEENGRCEEWNARGKEDEGNGRREEWKTWGMKDVGSGDETIE
jgi:hypothetical protein